MFHRRLGRRRPASLLAASIAALVLMPACERDIELPTGPAGAGIVRFDEVPASAVVLVGASDIGTCTNDNDEATAKLLDGIPGTVMAVGDNAYPAGTATDYATCYAPTWGRHRARTRPAMGQRDTTAAGAAYYEYFGSAAGEAGKGYYSYDLGAWHVIVLNTTLPHGAGSAQEQWLRADLAANPSRCTIAYWHQPRFFSAGTSGITGSLAAVWSLLYEAGVDVVVNGNRRFYERFAKQKPDGTADGEYGVRQFIVGTGGAGTNSLGTIRANSEVQNSGTYGVLKLVLDTDRYSWEFVPVAGRTFTDQGSTDCHERPGTRAHPGGPYESEGTVTFDGSHSTDPQRDYPLTFAWDFGDGNTGTGARVAHTYAQPGTYAVSLVATDAAGNASPPATTTATIGNLAPIVSATPVASVAVGAPARMQAYVSDPGSDDAPWSWRVDWGDGASDAGTTSDLTVPVSATHAYATAGKYAATLTVTDKDGGSGVAATTYTVGSSETAIILAAGDISACFNDNDEGTARILDANPGTVFTLGDNAYPGGSAADYANCYAPTWGRHRARTFAALGNHDYGTGNADATFEYFGSRAGPRGKGYYSVDIGAWHVIVLNDNPPYVEVTDGSEQDRWLQADLAANRARCTLAIWHQPRFYSPDGITNKRANFWNRIYAAGVDLVLNGHEHGYQRFAPLAPDGTPNAVAGIRQIIVGTGGEGTGNIPSPIAPNTEAISNAYGVLKVTLRPDGYDWEFLSTSGSFTDSGSDDCHGPPTGETTSVELSSSYNPSFYGQPVTFTARVETRVGLTPDGLVTFVRDADCSDTAGRIGEPVALMSGRASITVSSLAVEGAPHQITACYGGGASFAPSSGTMDQAVTAAPVAISLSGLTHTYDGTAKAAMVATDPAGVPVSVSYTLDGTLVAQPTNGGQYAVAAASTSANYAGAAAGVLTILQAPQATAFDALTARTVGDPDFAITASSSASLPVAFTSTTDACAVVAAATSGATTTGTVRLTNAGLDARGCTIRATQPGDGNYLAAADVTRTFDVLARVDADDSIKWDGRGSRTFRVRLLSVRLPDGTFAFDARQVDVASVQLTGTKGTAGIALNKGGNRKYALADVNGDGAIDLDMEFDALALFLGTDLGVRQVTLTATLRAPTVRPIRGVDSITIRR